MKPLSKTEIVTLIAGIVIILLLIIVGGVKNWFSPYTPSSLATTPTITPSSSSAASGPSATNTSSTTMTTVQGTNISTNSQIEIIDTKVGTGATAVNGSHVYVNYTGTLTDGTKFDSSYDRGQPIDFTLGSGQVIPGWEIGILGMKVGGTRHLVIQPSLAYGAQAVGPIPANSVLVFDVALVDVK